jgi:hypothetical protein
VLVDNIAKAYWNHPAAKNLEPTAHRFGSEAWALYVDGGKVGKFDKQQLYKSIHKEKVMAYWVKKSDRHREAIRGADWNFVEQLLNDSQSRSNGM